MKNKKIVMILADGFEETEAIAVADVLRRLDFDLLLAGMDSAKVTGAHNITVKADCLLTDVDAEELDAVILPGGMPGAMNLRNSELVMQTVRTVYEAGKVVAAICAAPIALERAGVLEGRNMTVYPGFENYFTDSECTAARVEVDGNVVTGRGPGASFEFAAGIARTMGVESSRLASLFDAMFIQG
jgi:4-methyl-5(b-hydroxyethyl)-thiazole monophosphate biosynthesis